MEQVFAFLEQQSYEAEVIVVENGSTDQTLELAKQYLPEHHNLQVLHEAGQGKGLAVRGGMRAAQGQYRFMCDVDLSMPLSEINRFLPPALPDCDIALASREAQGAIRYGEPYYRHFVGRIYNGLIRFLAVMASGVFAALGGLYLSLGDLWGYTDQIASGRGFIGMALNTFAGGSPLGVFLSSLLFGFTDKIGGRLQAEQIFPVYFIQMLPYIITLIALTYFTIRKTQVARAKVEKQRVHKVPA